MRKEDEIRLGKATDWLRRYASHYSDDPEQRRSLVERAIQILKDEGSEIDLQSEFTALHRAMQEKLH